MRVSLQAIEVDIGRRLIMTIGGTIFNHLTDSATVGALDLSTISKVDITLISRPDQTNNIGTV